jgi:hypothetical protein
MRLRVAILTLLVVVAPLGVTPADTGPAGIRAAVARALPLIAKSAAEYSRQRDCFSCHHQAVPVVALAIARERGIAVDAASLQAQLQFTEGSLRRGRDDYRQGRGQGGQVDTAGYALWTLEAGGWKPDKTTAAVTEYLLQRNQELDYWKPSANRPPAEASDFTATYLALRALKAFGTPEQKERIAARVEKARRWLLATAARDTEDRVFRLWALKYAGAHNDDLKAAVNQLLKTQRADGGWAQAEGLESDAYATGSALAALHLAGGLAVSAPTYRRGIHLLVTSQQPDGSWLVHTRSRPIQTYFESGFPYGKDQFISMAASGWAVAALALACPRGDGAD